MNFYLPRPYLTFFSVPTNLFHTHTLSHKDQTPHSLQHYITSSLNRLFISSIQLTAHLHSPKYFFRRVPLEPVFIILTLVCGLRRYPCAQFWVFSVSSLVSAPQVPVQIQYLQKLQHSGRLTLPLSVQHPFHS